MKKLLHRIGMGFYMLGYSVWVKIGKKMYWDDMMLVREEGIWNDE